MQCSHFELPIDIDSCEDSDKFISAGLLTRLIDVFFIGKRPHGIFFSTNIDESTYNVLKNVFYIIQNDINNKYKRIIDLLIIE